MSASDRQAEILRPVRVLSRVAAAVEKSFCIIGSIFGAAGAQTREFAFEADTVRGIASPIERTLYLNPSKTFPEPARRHLGQSCKPSRRWVSDLPSLAL